VVGILDNVQDAMTFHFRQPDRAVFLLRGSAPCAAADAEIQFGSSEYAKEILGAVWGLPPSLDLKKEAALQKCLLELIKNRDIESAHDCSEGGLAVALAESAFVAGIGAEIDLPSAGMFPDAILFGEDAGRVVISCDPTKAENIQRIAVKWGIRADRIGRTLQENLTIKIDGKTAIAAAVSELKKVWETSLTQALHAETLEHLVPETLQKS